MKTNKRDANRDAIVKAAESLFQRWGIAKTTLEDIATAAGKKKSAIYYYFAGKEDIVEAVAFSQAEHITRIIRAEIAKKESAKDKLLAYVYTTFSETRRAITLFEIARGELRANQGVIHKVIDAHYAQEEKIIAEILTYGHARGEFKELGHRDLKTTGHAILTILRSLIISLYIENDDRLLIDLIIEILAKGL
jgi:AcrR family transcriptional regulator